ncbi:9441_t:CDS:2 [Cetraspora pellucida]|uniref:9441_t:CDS:1 n=1 Tax=Cetraspora pellucida TaxID=1433469 RepID=A0A9N9EBZ3_9GLOM|nr:9441_t:CDS:2 [Cetraspora pellucida]
MVLETISSFIPSHHPSPTPGSKTNLHSPKKSTPTPSRKHSTNHSTKSTKPSPKPTNLSPKSSPKPSLSVNKLLVPTDDSEDDDNSDDEDNGDDEVSTPTRKIRQPTKSATRSTSLSIHKSATVTATPLAATLSSNTATITSDNNPLPTLAGITNSSAQAPIPCLDGDSINSLSCQDSTHYYCNVTDHQCYARLSDNSQCQDDSVCNLNSVCSENVCVPSNNSTNSSPDIGKIAMIVGPILGALLLLAALLFCFCCMRRKKRRENADSMHDNPYPFAARPNSYSSSAPPPSSPMPLMHNYHNTEHTNSHSLSPEMVAIAAGAVNRNNSPEESNNRLGNQNSSTELNQAYLSCPTSISSSLTPPNDDEKSTENVRLSKFMFISNALNSGNTLRDSNTLSKDDLSTRSNTPKGPFMLGGISSEMNSPTLPLEDLTDRGSTQSCFSSSNRDSDVLPTMDQDEFGKSPESVYLGLEFTSQSETKPTNKGRYTMGSMYSMYSTYSTDYSNLPNSPSFNLLRGMNSSVTASKSDHSRIRNDSFSTVTTQTISNAYDDSRSSVFQLNAPIFNNFNNNSNNSNNGNNGRSLTPTHEYSDSTYSTASSLSSNSSSHHTLTPKNMRSTNNNDDQTSKYKAESKRTYGIF